MSTRPAGDWLDVPLPPEGRGFPVEIGRRYRVRVPGARWSVARARVGETVQALVDSPGLPEGGEAVVRVWERDPPAGPDGRADDDLVATLRGVVQDGRLVADWACVWVDDLDDPVPLLGRAGAPEYYFAADLPAGEVLSGREPDDLLQLVADLEVRLLEPDGAPRAGAPFEVRLAGGGVVTGTTDALGRARVEGVPPGRWHVQVRGERRERLIDLS